MPGESSVFAGIPHWSNSSFEKLLQFCKENSEDVLATLPWLAAEIADNEGHKMMLRFVRHWSGARVYVHKDHALFTERVGFDFGARTHMRCLRDANDASQIEVPSAWGVFLALRRVAIAAASRSHMPREEIVRRFGVTMRSLR